MARSLSQTLILSRLSPLFQPSSRLFNHRRCSCSTDPPAPVADPEMPSKTGFPAGLQVRSLHIKEQMKPVFLKVEQLKLGTSDHTLTDKVLSSKMVLHKGQGTVPHLCQSWIAVSEVLAAFGVDPSQNIQLRAAREDLRPGSSAADKGREDQRVSNGRKVP